MRKRKDEELRAFASLHRPPHTVARRARARPVDTSALALLRSVAATGLARRSMSTGGFGLAEVAGSAATTEELRACKIGGCCGKDTPLLPEDDVASRMAALPNWRLSEDKKTISRSAPATRSRNRRAGRLALEQIGAISDGSSLARPQARLSQRIGPLPWCGSGTPALSPGLAGAHAVDSCHHHSACGRGLRVSPWHRPSSTL